MKRINLAQSAYEHITQSQTPPEPLSYLPSLLLSYIPVVIIFVFYLIINALFTHFTFAYIIILTCLFFTTNLTAYSILSAQIQYFAVYWRAALLANAFLVGFIVAVNSGDVLRPFGLYMMVLSFFHTTEFLFTAMYNHHDVSTDSFLLNHSIEYGLAAAASWIEFAIETFFFPSIKTSLACLYIGLSFITFGELFRKLAMYTAGCSFNHYVQEERRRDHILITRGIYSLCRHPSYLGWFAWSVGTQVLLSNPICTIIYAVVSWNFFKNRIIYEEYYLIKFFGKQYIDYQKRVWSGMPFVKGFLLVDEALD